MKEAGSKQSGGCVSRMCVCKRERECVFREREKRREREQEERRRIGEMQLTARFSGHVAKEYGFEVISLDNRGLLFLDFSCQDASVNMKYAKRKKEKGKKHGKKRTK